LPVFPGGSPPRRSEERKVRGPLQEPLRWGPRRPLPATLLPPGLAPRWRPRPAGLRWQGDFARFWALGPRSFLSPRSFERRGFRWFPHGPRPPEDRPAASPAESSIV